jgi:hypothetical protein
MHNAMSQGVEEFVKKWAASGAAERANKDLFLAELCDVLGVSRPNPAKGDTTEDTYVFERAATLAHEGGEATIGRIDLYKQGCFILEAKQASGEGTSKLGKAKRGTPAWNILMKEAFGQALGYARSFDKPEPFVIVCDIGHCLDLYATFDGTWNYRPFPNAQTSRIFLRDLAEQADTLRRIFEEPLALDPSRHAAKITREVAAHIASLAKKLEDDGHSQELVAQFLMRCLFTMFAEDVGLLPEGLFTKALKDLWLPHPASFPGGVESLWRTMNEGGELFGVVGKILRFNGGLFANPKALKLDKEALHLLWQAAECNWSDVEPAIFGTLLERALDAKERHALGAHYTPRAYVERLVRPTIEEPLRADWEIVQAQVRRIVVAAEESKSDKASKDKLKEAVAVVREFHHKLCTRASSIPRAARATFFTSPSICSSAWKARCWPLAGIARRKANPDAHGIRARDARAIPRHRDQTLGQGDRRAGAVDRLPAMALPHVRQEHARARARLQDYKNIECRDAVLAYDGEPELVRDEKGKPITRWDGETMKTNPVTGEQVPDEIGARAGLQVQEPAQGRVAGGGFHRGESAVHWEQAMRLALGQGYVEATSRAPTPDSAGDSGLRHVLVEPVTGAAVRIGMTAAQAGASSGVLQKVVREIEGVDGVVGVDLLGYFGQIHPDLTVGADVSGAFPLRANAEFSFQGVIPLGNGFRLTRNDLSAKGIDPNGDLPSVIRPMVIGRDIAQRPEERWVIDFFGLSESEAEKRYPALYQHLLVYVKPERDLNRRDTRRKNWWLFGENAPKMRRALSGLGRFIATIETSKHKPFVFLDACYLADHKVYAPTASASKPPTPISLSPACTTSSKSCARARRSRPRTRSFTSRAWCPCSRSCTTISTRPSSTPTAGRTT